MKTFYAPDQALHAPEKELFNGAFHPAAETPARLEAMLGVVGETFEPEPIPRAILERVHTPDYLDFIEQAHALWVKEGRMGEAFPYVFPVVGRRAVNLKRIDALMGRYSMDCGTPIGAHTLQAALGGASSAYSGAKSVLGGDQLVFALCRPPGHHAGADYFGGYSYLNNAALAAETALVGGAKRVAILDVDYHHGNGTQDIFYGREDVFFASLHADPVMDYPFYWGHSDERGEGAGAGFKLNLPLPRGTGWPDYQGALSKACEAIGAYRPDILIVSYGADTFDGDPISYFTIKTDEYEAMGRVISETRLPTLVCMEGGYAVDHLGANLAAFLRGLEGV